VFENIPSAFSALGLGYLVLAAWPLAKTDILERRLPNKYVLPAFPITLAGQILAISFGESYWKLIWALASAVVTFALALLINIAGLMGMGDVKLMAAMALALGWYSPLLAIFALAMAFVVAGVAVILKRLIRKATGSLPLGPYLMLGLLASATWAVWS
jgi:leader peptidase (prepilin peptidase) / N-methyltransferase